MSTTATAILGLAVMVSATLIGAWAYRNSEKERAELSEATQELKTALRNAIPPPLDRLIHKITRR